MAETVELMVNGAPQSVPAGSTVTQLLEQLQIKPERVVVEVSLKILRRHEHEATVLQTGDRVEIVRFVGGGAVDNAPRQQVRSLVGSRDAGSAPCTPRPRTEDAQEVIGQVIGHC